MMNRRNTGVMLAAGVAVLGAALVGSAASTTAPASAPASPKAVVLSVLQAGQTGDLTSVLAHFLSDTQEQKDAAEGLMLEVLRFTVVEHAMRQKWPDAKLDDSDGPFLAKDIERARGAVEKIEGDKASVYLPREGKVADPLPERADITLKKTAGGWKVDATVLPAGKSREERLAQLRKEYAVAGEVAAEIKAGKYATSAEASAAMQARFKALHKERKKDEPAKEKAE